jgi:hypothetical protein
VPTPLTDRGNFIQFIGQLARPSLAEFVAKAAIVPKGLFAGPGETGPDAFAQIAKDCTGIAGLVRE